MKTRILTLYFILYILIGNNSLFLLQQSLYGLKTTPGTKRSSVCLVIVDGLRYDQIEHMPFLSTIINSDKGILYRANSGIPSLSRPGYERILTGTDTEINCINSNNNFIPSLTPNLFQLSKNKGLKTGFSGFFWFDQLYPLQIDYTSLYYVRDGSTFKDGSDIITSHKPDFMVIHPMLVDIAGHKFGGSSIQYLAACKIIDRNIHELWNLINPMGYTLLVVSDHGHKDEGGHGGDDIHSVEIPIAIISNELKNLKLCDTCGIKNQRDIAPTICDILGLSKTIYMTGESLVINNPGSTASLRQIFFFNSQNNFAKIFKITSLVTYIIISLHTAVYFGCMLIALKIIKPETKG